MVWVVAFLMFIFGILPHVNYLRYCVDNCADDVAIFNTVSNTIYVSFRFIFHLYHLHWYWKSSEWIFRRKANHLTFYCLSSTWAGMPAYRHFNIFSYFFQLNFTLSFVFCGKRKSGMSEQFVFWGFECLTLPNLKNPLIFADKSYGLSAYPT